MKTTSTILAEFIQDFDLEPAEVGLCFDAMIYFNITRQKFNFESGVLMESFLLNKIDTIYLLNPITEIYNIPASFKDVEHQYIYFKKKGLFIPGYTPSFGSYSISIVPVGRNCTQKTYNELRAKKFN